jgi:hypothetical protein
VGGARPRTNPCTARASAMHRGPGRVCTPCGAVAEQAVEAQPRTRRAPRAQAHVFCNVGNNIACPAGRSVPECLPTLLSGSGSPPRTLVPQRRSARPIRRCGRQSSPLTASRRVWGAQVPRECRRWAHDPDGDRPGGAQLRQVPADLPRSRRPHSALADRRGARGVRCRRKAMR